MYILLLSHLFRKVNLKPCFNFRPIITALPGRILGLLLWYVMERWEKYAFRLICIFFNCIKLTCKYLWKKLSDTFAVAFSALWGGLFLSFSWHSSKIFLNSSLVSASLNLTASFSVIPLTSSSLKSMASHVSAVSELVMKNTKIS